MRQALNYKIAIGNVTFKSELWKRNVQVRTPLGDFKS